MKAYSALRSFVLITALVAAVTIGAAPARVLAAPPAQANLLTNGGMETFGSNGLATGWEPWWQTIANPGNGNLNYAQPPNFGSESNPVFVHSGGLSSHIGRSWDPWFGGIRQTISVAPGTTVRITGYTRVFASTPDFPAPSDTAVQSRAQIGAEPNGSIDWSVGTVVWSGTANPHDTWAAVSLDVTAGAAGKITIFLSTNYKGDSRYHLDAWWDDVSATVISSTPNTAVPGNTSAPQATSGGGSGPVATNPPVQSAATSTPDANGNIIYVVQAGDALWSIAAENGLTVDELKAMNGLTSDIISIGQKLIVGTSTPSASPTPTVDPNQPTADPNATATTDPNAAASATPEVDAQATQAAGQTQVALATDTLATGTVCALLWNDANGNGVRDAVEGLLAGGQLTVVDIATGAPVQAYTTDGVNEPHCFDDLVAGQYTISAASPGGYNPTTNTSTPLEVSAGSTSTLEFGAQPSAAVAEQPDTPATSSSQALLTALLFAGGVVFLLLAAGVAGFLLLRRPRAR